jgi:hypothetical protein
VAWNSWYSVSPNAKKNTLATLYKTYKDSSNTYTVSSSAKVTDGFSLELLAHWCSCYASHCNWNGEASGSDFTREFMKNLQVLLPTTQVVSFLPIDFPEALESFLQSVKVPYLVGPDSFNPQFNESISEFITIGKSYRPKNKVGWDVVFDAFVGGAKSSCLIECKLWERSIDIALIYKYYKRACDIASPVSFLVCRKFQATLLKKFDSLTQNDVDSAILSRPQDEIDDDDNDDSDNDAEGNGNVEEVDVCTDYPSKKPKRVALEKQPDFISNFNSLFQKRVNIYTVAVSSESVIHRMIPTTSVFFEIEALKEFENPTGVFIIIQTTFSPTSRSSQS